MFYSDFAKILTSATIDSFFGHLFSLVKSSRCKKYAVLRFDGSTVADVVIQKGFHENFFVDISDLNFEQKPFNENILINFFGEEIKVEFVLYIYHNSSLFAAVLLNSINPLYRDFLKENADALSLRYFEILVKDKRTEVYVEYQKKIDFIKVVSNIFRNLSVEEILSAGVGLFTDVFAAQASCVIYEGKFIPIGVSQEDLQEITVDGAPLIRKITQMQSTYFIKEKIESVKYNIENIFFIFEPKYKMRVVLFNISVDFAPDVEFSQIVTSILTIALENAFAHEKMVELKVHESEMQKTAQILNMFVNKEIYVDSEIKGYGVSIPAKVAGGDFLYFVENDNEFFVCIADVCGKGYSAAVLTVVMSTFAEMQKHNDKFDILLLAKTLSGFLISKNLEGRFVTAFIGVIDKESLNIKYISLGHEPVYIISNDKINELDSNYFPIGIIDEEYEIHEAALQRGDYLFLFTDGIVEYIDYDKLKSKILEIKHTKLEDFVKSLYKFCVTDEKNQKDDFTCAILKI